MSTQNVIGTITVGTSGVAVSEVVGAVDVPTSTDVSEIIKVVVQVIIAVATLLGLFRKKVDTKIN